jgi:hypothetical protein
MNKELRPPPIHTWPSNGLRRLQTTATRLRKLLWDVAYAKGRGIAQDMEKARYWFDQAKAKGNSDAAANLRRLR